jgi:kinesin family protein 3/17
MSKKEETVRVCVRCRPLNDKEHTDGRQRIVSMDTKSGQCSVIAPGSDRHSSEPPKNFTFDQVYDESVSQEYIYMNTASRIVDSVLEGFNGTIFA